MHQPLQPPLNEASSNLVVGGTLTSTPLESFFSNQPGVVMNFDQLVDLPYPAKLMDDWIFQTTDTSASRWIADPFKYLAHVPLASHVHHLPLAFMAVQGCHFYDYDVEVTLLLVKHERGRGLYQITVAPDDFADQSSTYPGLQENLFQKHLWDIELSDTITFMVKSPKNFAWRSLFKHANTDNFPNTVATSQTVDASGPPTNYVITSKLTSANLQTDADYKQRGTFYIDCITPYNASNVGPSAATCIPFYRLVNLRTAEYRPPYGLNPGDQPIIELS